MMKITQKNPSRSGLRRAVKVLTWLFVILICLPIAVFALWNTIDEAPNANATRYLKVPAQRMPDAENAWLLLAGLDAAGDINPISYGRQRVDAYRARAAQSPMPKPDAAEIALFKESLPAVGLDAALDGVTEFCVREDGNCLQWAQQHGAALKRLQLANAVRLARTQELMQLPGWQNLYPNTLDRLYPNSGTFALQRLLSALPLAQSEANPGAASEALAQLGKTVAFWRRVRASPQDIISIGISGREIEAAMWLVSEWLARASPSAIAANAQALDQILAAPTTKLDWFEAMGGEFRAFEHTLHGAMPGVASTLWHCVRGSAAARMPAANDSCLFMSAMNLAYVHQATMNLGADNYAQIQRVSEASLQQLPAAEATAGVVMDRCFPQFDNVRALMRKLSYNFTGRILAGIAIPAFDFGKRELDRDALRRMVQLKREARLAGITPAAMQRFVLARPHLQSPPDGLPIVWDQASSELSFLPLAKQYWKREVIVVGLLAPKRPGK